jgi:hypothetical protein
VLNLLKTTGIVFSDHAIPNSIRQNPETVSIYKSQFFNKTNVGIFFVLLKGAKDENKFQSNKVFNVNQSGKLTVHTIK